MTKLIMILGVLIGTLISGKSSPSEAELLGRWGCSGDRLVFMARSGPEPDIKDVDSHLKAMGATESNCVLTFSQGHKASLRLGDKSFGFSWTLDARTHEFKATAGPFSITGYLVREGNKLILAYSRKDLFTIMRFLCTPSGRKHISPLGNLLDSTEGLSIAMDFTRQ